MENKYGFIKSNNMMIRDNFELFVDWINNKKTLKDVIFLCAYFIASIISLSIVILFIFLITTINTPKPVPNMDYLQGQVDYIEGKVFVTAKSDGTYFAIKLPKDTLIINHGR